MPERLVDMPSPNHTNYEKLYVPESWVRRPQLAFDAMPTGVRALRAARDQDPESGMAQYADLIERIIASLPDAQRQEFLNILNDLANGSSTGGEMETPEPAQDARPRRNPSDLFGLFPDAAKIRVQPSSQRARRGGNTLAMYDLFPAARKIRVQG
jgi:hypothetical protein